MHTCHVLLRLRGFAATVAAAAWATLVFGLVVPTHGALALGCSANSLSRAWSLVAISRTGGQPAVQGAGWHVLFPPREHHCSCRKLIFIEPAAESQLKGQDFWATSIIIENGGAILAGVMMPRRVWWASRRTAPTRRPHVPPYGSDPRGNDVMKSEGPANPAFRSRTRPCSVTAASP